MSAKARREKIAATIQKGEARKDEVFFLLVDSIRRQAIAGIPDGAGWAAGVALLADVANESDSESNSAYEDWAALLNSVCPDDKEPLLDALSSEVGPGYAFTNVVIARALAEKPLSPKEKNRICKVLLTIYRRWSEQTHYERIGWRQAEMARDGIVLMARLAPLSAESYGMLLEVLKNNGDTYGGLWLARFLCTQMSKKDATQLVHTVLDVLERPPRDHTFCGYDDNVAEIKDRVPGVFGPEESIRAPRATQDYELSPDEEFFLHWCNGVLDPALPKSVPEAMRSLVIRSGDAGLPAVFHRLADSSRSSETRLQFLVCIAEVTRDVRRFSEPLVDVLNAEVEPDWMLVAEVVRTVRISKQDTSQFVSAWQRWCDTRKPGYILDSDYRFLFAIGDSDDGLRVLEEELPRIQTLQASPPFYMFFLEDVPYAPDKYEMVLKRLLTANVWWHRCAAIVLLHRYTDYFDSQSGLLKRIANDDQSHFVREVSRQIQREDRQ